MGFHIREREAMKLLNYGVHGKHMLTRSKRVTAGLLCVRAGLRIGSWLGGFSVTYAEPRVELFKVPENGTIEIEQVGDPRKLCSE